MFRNFARNYEKRSIWISVLMIILAIFLIIAPATSAVTAIYMFGVFVLISGIIHIVSYCKASEEERFVNFEFAEGILSILGGLLIIIVARDLVPFLTTIIGVWIIIKSIIKMQMALNIRSEVQSHWVLTLVFSIISLILGIFIIMNPVYGLLTISILGIAILVYEILNLVEAIYNLNKLK